MKGGIASRASVTNKMSLMMGSVLGLSTFSSVEVVLLHWKQNSLSWMFLYLSLNIALEQRPSTVLDYV